MSLSLINPNAANIIDRMINMLSMAGSTDGWIPPADAVDVVVAFDKYVSQLDGKPHSIQAAECLRSYGYIEPHQVSIVARILDNHFGEVTRLMDIINQQKRKIEDLEVGRK